MLAAITAAFKGLAAIPDIIDAIKQLGAAIEKMNMMAYLKESASTRKEVLELEEGDLESYRTASKRIHDLIAKLS